MLLNPGRIRAGETTAWTLSLAAYPASLWALKLKATKATHAFTVTATAAGDDHQLDLTATASAAIPAGTYRYNLVVEQGEGAELVRHVVEVGDLAVEALVGGVTAADARTWAQRVLDDLEAAYADYVATGALRTSYSVDGRSVSFGAHSEILAAIDRARAKVARESRKALGRGFPKIHTRFRV